MENTEQIKKRKIYFFLMSIGRNKKSTDDTPAWTGEQAANALTNMLSDLMLKNPSDRAFHHSAQKKYIWLHEYDNLQNGNINIVFMSGRYDQSREVVATPTLEEKGIALLPDDAPKEKTHMCIRLAAGQDRFIVALESNRDGIMQGSIALYLNEQFDYYNTVKHENYSYQVSFESLPSKDFLEELVHMKKISVLSIKIDRQDLTQNDFASLAGLNELSDTLEIVAKRKRGKNFNIPTNIIHEYYNDTGVTKKFKRLTVQGAGQSGNSLRIDTESMQMQHSIIVKTTILTHEVDSTDFFQKAQEVIREIGG